jgi:hypothetical protein
MALKGKPIPISTAATTIYTCPAGTEASVHGLIFSNNTGGALSVNVLVFNQADNTTVTVATGLIVPANQFITWTKPINLAAGDIIQAVSSAATGIVCLFSVFEGSAAPVAIGFTGRGEWSNVSSYLVNDIVSVTGTGTFLSLAESTNQDPTSNTAAWMFLEGISASALPPQGGQDGKFLTTDGTDASWAEVDVSGGAEIIDPMTSDITLTSANKRVQVYTPIEAIRKATLPVAGTLTLGESFIFVNKGSTRIEILNDSGQLLISMLPGTATKMLLVDTVTTDWEAYRVEMYGVLQAIAQTQLGYTLNPVGLFVGSTVDKITSNQYQVFAGARRSPNYWGADYVSQVFTVNTSIGVIETTPVRSNSLGGGYGNRIALPYSGNEGLQNPIAFLDTHIVMAMGDGRTGGSTRTGGRTILYTANTNIVQQEHITAAEFADADAAIDQPCAKLSNRKGITVYSAFSDNTNQLSYRIRVIDYSSSLTAPTLGTIVNYASGGSRNPTSSDLDRLEDNKVLFFFNKRTTNTGPDQFEKMAAVITVSGTVPTVQTAVTVAPSTGINNNTLKIRALSATKAVAAYRVGFQLRGKILSISGNTITVGSEFLIADTPFSASAARISKGSNDDEFLVTTHNTGDNNTLHAKLVTISGSSFVSETAFSKFSSSVTSIHGNSSGALYDPTTESFIVGHASNNLPEVSVLAKTNI